MKGLQEQRLSLLSTLDAAKTRQERNKLGQFATPPRVADEMVTYALQQVQKKEISYLEPGFGTGAFYTSLLNYVDSVDVDINVIKAHGYEIDSHYAEPTRRLMELTPLDLQQEDFTKATPEPFDVILCNPPYVRHHHMESSKKITLASQITERYKVRPTGLTGLYNYFMMLGEGWLSNDGIAAWLVPSEFLDVNYGVAVKSFLLQNVILTRIHLFRSEDVQFDDALVSSVVVWYRKGKPTPNHSVELSYGGSLLNPVHIQTVAHATLNPMAKWTRQIRKGNALAKPVQSFNGSPSKLKDFFDIKRGLATGDNSFFILTEEQANQYDIAHNLLTPVLPSPRHLKSNIVDSDKTGNPIIEERLFLLNCRLTPDMLAKNYPAAWAYLQTGFGNVSEKYLCRSRKLWYLQESREPAPLLCSYMGRGPKGSNQPFRFILNHSNAVATNSYLMLYPKPFWRNQAKLNPELLYKVWQMLSAIKTEDLTDQGRTYGGGLEKMEPSELGNVPVNQLISLIKIDKPALFEFAEAV